ncbi:uncharacterized protein LOC135373461 [Ornithodoros turicata]|uniref:uncharacterized protein LOC135373461 n=1 Tax=Ornithodoros turicata TaxID=34597 RepID=UPI003139B5E3
MDGTPTGSSTTVDQNLASVADDNVQVVSSHTNGEQGADSEATPSSGLHGTTRIGHHSNVDAGTRAPNNGNNADVFDIQSLMQAAVQAAVREAMDGARQLYESPRPPQRTVASDESSPVGYLASASANLIPTYDPATNTQPTVEAWINKVDGLAAAYGWNDKQTSCFALSKLEGVARSWYDGLTTTQYTWVEWKSKLREAFPSSASFQQLLREMEARKRKRDETIEIYFYDKLAKARRCGLDDPACIEYIITGLNDENAVRSLSVREFANSQELLRCLKLLDERLDIVKHSRSAGGQDSSKSAKQSTGQTASSKGKGKSKYNDKGEPLCFNCSEYGHLSAACPQPQRKPRCDKCKRTGHEIKDCRQDKGKGSATPKSAAVLAQNVVTAEGPANAKYFMTALLDGKEVEAFVDMGSQCVTLRKTNADELSVQYSDLSAPFEIHGYGSGKIIPIGKARLELKADEATATVDVYVVPENAQVVPLLIGQPFTEQPHVTVIRRGNMLRNFEEHAHLDEDGTLQDIKIPALAPRHVSLWAKKKTVIPPNYVGLVTLYTKEENMGDVYVDAQYRAGRGYEHCILSCVLREDEQQEYLMPVANVSEHELSIQEDDRMVRAQWCKPEDTPTVVEVLSNNEGHSSEIKASEINVGTSVTPAQAQELAKLLNDYRDCFAQSMPEICCTALTEMRIDLIEDSVVKFRPYRLAHSEREVVRGIVRELEEAGIVKESNSEFASPILLVTKKTGEKRLCVDLRALNRITKKESYPLPLIDDQLDRLHDKKYFTTLDLASGYYQVPITESSRSKTAFVTPDGHYEFTRMPFGLVNAPAVFQRMINAVLCPLRHDSYGLHGRPTDPYTDYRGRTDLSPSGVECP